MTKMTVFFVNWKTYASQLSGSPIGFLLPTKSAFKVHPGKGNNWLFVRSKGVFIPLDKDLSKNSSYICSGSATGSIRTDEPTFFLVGAVHFGLRELAGPSWSLDFLMTF